jgi:hypothetical protein
MFSSDRHDEIELTLGNNTVTGLTEVFGLRVTRSRVRFPILTPTGKPYPYLRCHGITVYLHPYVSYYYYLLPFYNKWTNIYFIRCMIIDQKEVELWENEYIEWEISTTVRNGP